MDNKDKVGLQDRQRINVNESYELYDWAERLGVSPAELKNAVEQVGPMVEDVQDYLGRFPKR